MKIYLKNGRVIQVSKELAKEVIDEYMENSKRVISFTKGLMINLSEIVAIK